MTRYFCILEEKRGTGIHCLTLTFTLIQCRSYLTSLDLSYHGYILLPLDMRDQWNNPLEPRTTPTPSTHFSRAIEFDSFYRLIFSDVLKCIILIVIDNNNRNNNRKCGDVININLVKFIELDVTEHYIKTIYFHRSKKCIEKWSRCSLYWQHRPTISTHHLV